MMKHIPLQLQQTLIDRIKLGGRHPVGLFYIGVLFFSSTTLIVNQVHSNRADSMFGPANERRRYNVTPSLISWAQT